MAIGVAKLFGIDLMENFRRPYLATSMGDFWRRWHISLSTWFRDYIYIPMGGSRVSEMRHYFNLFVTFLISGLWHGAAWTFVAWGGLHGILLIIEAFKKRHLPQLELKGRLSLPVNIVVVSLLATFAWIFFRMPTFSDAFDAVAKIFTTGGQAFYKPSIWYGVISLLILVCKDIVDEYQVRFNFLNSKYVVVRYATVICLISYILLFGVLDGGQFIYFQF